MNNWNSHMAFPVYISSGSHVAAKLVRNVTTVIGSTRLNFLDFNCPDMWSAYFLICLDAYFLPFHDAVLTKLLHLTKLLVNG